MYKKIAYGGMAAALCVILLALSAYMPTCKAAMLFAASALVYVVRVLSGIKTALAMYAASSVLGFLIASGGSPAITAAFIVCLGNYPVVRFFAERRKTVLSVIIKAVLYLVYFAVFFAVFKYLIPVHIKYAMPVVFVTGAVIFAAYDILLAYTGDYIVNALNKRK